MDEFGRSALSEDDLADRTGFDQLEKAPNIATTIRMTTSQKIAENIDPRKRASAGKIKAKSE
jgi:hypothetical protein